MTSAEDVPEPVPPSEAVWVLGTQQLKTKLRPLMRRLEPGETVPAWARWWVREGGGRWVRLPAAGDET